MAVTLSEQEKQALNDVFISIGEKKNFFYKIIRYFKRLSVYICKFFYSISFNLNDNKNE